MLLSWLSEPLLRSALVRFMYGPNSASSLEGLRARLRLILQKLGNGRRRACANTTASRPVQV